MNGGEMLAQRDLKKQKFIRIIIYDSLTGIDE
nr:MAG TPA: hypothetical protein [Caudoviricetes sp.]